MKDSTTGYCSRYAGLFGCTTESEESKKLRGTRDILADILVIILFVHPTPPIRPGVLTSQQIICRNFLVYLYLKGSILKSSTLAFFY